jgi:hypothetical protein
VGWGEAHKARSEAILSEADSNGVRIQKIPIILNMEEILRTYLQSSEWHSTLVGQAHDVGRTESRDEFVTFTADLINKAIDYWNREGWKAPVRAGSPGKFHPKE